MLELTAFLHLEGALSEDLVAELFDLNWLCLAMDLNRVCVLRLSRAITSIFER